MTRRFDRKDHDIEDEIRFYLEERQRELESQGMSPGDAHRAALAAFGDPERVARAARESGERPRRLLRPAELAETTARNVRLALRRMGRRPGFTAVVALTLALGIGGVSAVFTVVNASLVRSLPFADAERLVFVQGAEDAPEGPRVRGASPPEARDWEALSTSFEEMAAVSGAAFTLSDGGGEAEVLAGETVDPGYFELLRVEPIAGRTFAAEEHRVGAAPVAAIGEGLWERRFGRDPQVLGRTIDLDGRGYTVVGVLPGSFPGAVLGTDVWIPLAATLTADDYEDRGGRWLSVVARLRPGVTLEAAAEDMAAVAARLETEHASTNTDRIALVTPMRDVYLGSTRTLLLVLLGASALLLAVAAVNIANLLLVRAWARGNDAVVQRALGASRAGLAGEVLAESAGFAALGAAGGLALGVWGAGALAAAMPPSLLPGYVEVQPDLSVFAAVAAIMALVGLLTGLAPALLGSRSGLGSRLRERGTAGVGARLPLQRILVAGEVALALVLLVGAGLMGRSLQAQLDVDPGFDAERLLVFRVDLPTESYAGAAERRAALATLVERLRSGPGVSAVTFGSDAPLRGRTSGAFLFTGESTADEDRIRFFRHMVDAAWFETMGIEVRASDAFAGFGAEEAAELAVISRAMAERHYGGTDPIGRTLLMTNGLSFTIVGVAEDVRYRDLTTDLLNGATDPDVYLPWAAFPSGTVEIVLRTDGDAATLGASARDALRAFDPDLPPLAMSPMTEVLRTQTAQGRFGSLLLVSFSALAALLAAVGLYGVLAFTVARRGREIAVRMAVGADRGGIRRLVLKDGLRLSLVGVAVGVVAAAAASRALAAFLFGVAPVDLPTYAAVAALMVGVAALASWIPAVRATRVDPQRALAGE